MAQGSQHYHVRALKRALDLLDAFSLSSPELSFTELVERVDLPKSTAVRLLAMLEDRHYVERSPETDRYRIGIRAFELGSIYIQTLRLEVESHLYLQRLAQDCNQTANLAVLDEGEIVHLVVVTPNRPIHFSAKPGQRDSAHGSGLGKVLLTALSDVELDRVVELRGLPQRTERSITSLDALRAHLAEVRQQGYAIDDEEVVEGLICVAAPILNDRGRVAGAVSVSGQSHEFGEPNRSRYIEAVRHTAAGISARLGYAVQMTDDRDETEPVTA
jgi:DNA-binding IclR family transcriptional regulator